MADNGDGNGDGDVERLYKDRSKRMVDRALGVAPAPAEPKPEPVRHAARRVKTIAAHLLPTGAAPAHEAASTAPASGANPSVWEPRREVPVLARCEVLVVGAGPAGLSAALGA